MWLGPSTLCHYFLLTELCLKWTILHGDSTVVCLNPSEYLFTSKGNKIQICVLSEYSRYSWITLNLPYRRANLHGENAAYIYAEVNYFALTQKFIFSVVIIQRVQLYSFMVFGSLLLLWFGFFSCFLCVLFSLLLFFISFLCVLYLPFFLLL